MTDQNRDESFDLAINPDSMELRLWKHVQGDARFARYVPWDELVVAEERERKRIADWLRNSRIMQTLADAIESGEHLK